MTRPESRTARRLAAAAAVLAALVTPGSASAADDPLRAQHYGLDTARFTPAWSTSTGRGVVIAVIDTGVDLGHPDLAAHLEPGRDFAGPGAMDR